MLTVILLSIPPMCYCSCWSWLLLYSAVFHSQADSLCSYHMQFWMSDKLFTVPFLNIHQNGVLTALFGCYMAGATWNCYCLCMFCVHHTTMHHVCDFMQDDIKDPSHSAKRETHREKETKRERQPDRNRQENRGQTGGTNLTMMTSPTSVNLSTISLTASSSRSAPVAVEMMTVASGGPCWPMTSCRTFSLASSTTSSVSTSNSPTTGLNTEQQWGVGGGGGGGKHYGKTLQVHPR